MNAQLANFVALLTTAIANTAANRRFTFGVKGQRGLMRHHIGGLAAFGIGLLFTSGSLAILEALKTDPHSALQVIVLTIANALATLTRFMILRLLMNREPRHVEPIHSESVEPKP